MSRNRAERSQETTGEGTGGKREKSVKSNAEGHEERLAKEIGREAKQEEMTVWE